MSSFFGKTQEFQCFCVLTEEKEAKKAPRNENELPVCVCGNKMTRMTGLQIHGYAEMSEEARCTICERFPNGNVLFSPGFDKQKNS